MVTLRKLIELIKLRIEYQLKPDVLACICETLGSNCGRIIGCCDFLVLFNEMTDSLTRVGGHPVTRLIEALRYKSEGFGFDFRWCHWNFPSGCSMAVWFTQPLIYMNARNIFWGVKAAGA